MSATRFGELIDCLLNGFGSELDIGGVGSERKHLMLLEVGFQIDRCIRKNNRLDALNLDGEVGVE